MTSTCNISTSPTDFDGGTTTMITSEVINNHNGPNFVSSEDYMDRGVQMIDGKTGDGKSVNAAADLDPSDLVKCRASP